LNADPCGSGSETLVVGKHFAELGEPFWLFPNILVHSRTVEGLSLKNVSETSV
jgi:hypothetical protein